MKQEEMSIQFSEALEQLQYEMTIGFMLVYSDLFDMYDVSVVTYGNGIDFWLRSQGEWVEIIRF